MKKFSVIIPTHNEWEWLEKTVNSVLLETEYPDYEVIIVADEVTDNSTSFLKNDLYSKVKTLNFNKSVWSPQARNEWAKIAKWENFVFIDSHTTVQKNWLDELAQQLENPSIWACTLNVKDINTNAIGQIYTLKDYLLAPTWKTPTVNEKMVLTSLIPGGCFALRSEIWNKVGWFDHGLQKWWREDAELSLKIWTKGYNLSMSQNSSISHYFKKRKFKVTWEEVMNNISRIILCFFDKKLQESFFCEIRKQFPTTLDQTLLKLNMDSNFAKYQKLQQSEIKRDMNQYFNEFWEYMPWLKL